jgi:hypothetical protein
MENSTYIYCLTCRVPRYEFSDKEIDRMRSHLAKQWGQNLSQVTEYEAVAYLRQDKAAAANCCGKKP